jgi:hypothetical protein
VGVDEIDARARPPVAEESVLDVGRTQRLVEQDVVLEVDLGGGEVIGGPAVASDRGEFNAHAFCCGVHSRSGSCWMVT